MICKVTSCYKTGLSREIGERRGRGGYQREKNSVERYGYFL